jgi:hypothetical protein
MNKYIPNQYKITNLGQIIIAHSCFEKPEYIKEITNTIDDCVAAFCKILKIEKDYRLNFVIYNSKIDFEIVAKRKISPSSLMVLFSDQVESTIGLFSCILDERNNDMNRMRRHIVHEIMHVWISIKTDSKRELGDQLRWLKIPNWIDEGLSEYVSLILMNRKSEVVIMNGDSIADEKTKLGEIDSSQKYKIATSLVSNELGNSLLINEFEIIDLLKRYSCENLTIAST